MRILVCMEARKAAVQPFSLELVSAARTMIDGTDGTIEALLIGPEATASAIGGVDAVLHISDAALPSVTAEAYCSALSEVVADRRPDIVLCNYSALGLDVAPWLAARTGWPLVGYCIGLKAAGSAVEATSQLYGGKIIARTRSALPAIFVVNPGSYPETTAAAPAPRIALREPRGWPALRVTFLEEQSPDASAADISKADRIVSVGRGIGEKSSIELATDLAAALDAEIAGSRPVVDGGWLPKERQVGKSGRRVKPKLYFAVGISGAPEHIEGMSKSDLIIAVNSDPKAPIFNVAHFGTTCDLFDLLPVLTERLKAGSA
jgi:electron transfer flavoprotein alpha subunit